MRIREFKNGFQPFLILILIMTAGCATSVRIRTIDSVSLKNGTQHFPVPIESPEKSYRLGERLSYNVRYMGINVGEVVAHVKGITSLNDREVYQIELRARTNKFFSPIFRVDDVIRTYVDTEQMYPLRFEKKIREGLYRAEETMDYDHINHTAIYSNGEVTKTMELAEGSQDALSAMYHFRFQDISVGTPVVYNVNADEKNYRLEARVIRAGVVTLPRLGSFTAIMVEPRAEHNGDPVKKGKAWAWFSADTRRVPLLVKVKSFIGTVNVYLKGIEEVNSGVADADQLEEAVLPEENAPPVWRTGLKKVGSGIGSTAKKLFRNPRRWTW